MKLASAISMVVAIPICLCAAMPAAAQPARSADQLVVLLKQALESNNAAMIEQLVHPGTEPASIRNVKAFAENIGKNRPQIRVYALAADDKEALEREKAAYRHGAHTPLEVRLRAAAERGFKPTLPPLGDIVIFVGSAPDPSRGMQMIYMYGQSEGEYFLVFNRRD